MHIRDLSGICSRKQRGKRSLHAKRDQRPSFFHGSIHPKRIRTIYSKQNNSYSPLAQYRSRNQKLKPDIRLVVKQTTRAATIVFHTFTEDMLNLAGIKYEFL